MVQLISLPMAMIAGGLVISVPADAADMDASLGGFVKFDAARLDRGRPSGALLDGEAHVEIDGQTDTGVSYGGRVQLLRTAEPRDNGSYIWGAWAWGEFRLGDYGGAAKELSVSAPTIGIGQIDGDLDRFGGPSALIAPYRIDNDDSTRLTYLSPAIFGFRLGLSYSPELSSAGVEIVPTPPVRAIDQHRDVTEIAIASSRDIGEATVTAAVAAVTGDAKPGAGLHDLAGGSAGARIAWNGFTVGGAFVYDGAVTLPLDGRPGHVLTDSIVSETNLGVTYETGHWGFGASWAHDDRHVLPATDIAAIGAVYRIAQGVSVAADLAHFSEPHGDGSALILQTAIHF